MVDYVLGPGDEEVDQVAQGGELVGVQGFQEMAVAPFGVRGLALIRTEFGRFGRQVSGCSLEHLLPEEGFDVARFLVGTVGTLAVTLAARLRMVREPDHRLLVM